MFSFITYLCINCPFLPKSNELKKPAAAKSIWAKIHINATKPINTILKKSLPVRQCSQSSYIRGLVRLHVSLSKSSNKHIQLITKVLIIAL